MIAKMDACHPGKSLESLPFGRCQLIPFGNDGTIAKMDVYFVEIRPIASDSGARDVAGG
jgi:hypothetical protein